MFRRKDTRRATFAVALGALASMATPPPCWALGQDAGAIGPSTTAAERTEPKRPTPPVPEWVLDARLYFVEVDRYFDGDTSNDPAETASWAAHIPTATPRADAEAVGAAMTTPVREAERRTYGGDLQGLSARLDHLEELAVNVLVLDPVFAGTGGHPKTVADPRHIDDAFGMAGSLQAVTGETDDPSTWTFTSTDRLFLEFVRTAHRRGFRVVLSGMFGDVGHAVAAPEAAERTLMAVTRRWLDPNGDSDTADGIDGWFVNFPTDEPLEFWPKWQAMVKSVNPAAALLYIDSSGVPSKTIRESFDAYVDVSASRAIRQFFRPGRTEPTLDAFLADLASRQATTGETERPARLTMLSDLPGPRLLTALDDPGASSAGVPSVGDNGPSAGAIDRWRLATILQHFYSAAPITYYGDEIGMFGACRPWPRPPMWWRNPPPGGETARGYRGDLFGLVRWLHNQRTRYAPLTRGGFEAVLQDEERRVFAVSRSLPGDRVILVVNYGDKKQKIMLPVGEPGTMVGLLSPNIKPTPARKRVPVGPPEAGRAKNGEVLSEPSEASQGDAGRDAGPHRDAAAAGPQVMELLDYSDIRRIRMGGSRQYVNEDGKVVVWVSPMSVRVVLVSSDEPWRRPNE
jgi:glycosidase